MPIETRDKKTGALIFEPTVEEKKQINFEKKIEELEKRIKILENLNGIGNR